MSAAHAQAHGPHEHSTPAPDHAIRRAPRTRRRLGWGVLLTLAFVAGEAIAGVFANSLALLSDAGHNFADAAALALSWYAARAAAKPARGAMTYGYHRVAILAALVNGLALIVIALVIVWEGIDRLRNPEEVSGGLMTTVAAVAVVMNLLISYWLHHGSKHDLNVRSAYIHMLGDAASAAGVVIAGIIVLTTGWHTADPIVSFLIAALILWSSWGVLHESVSVLLEAAPKGVNIPEVIAAVEQVEGVQSAHDLHVWTVGPGAIASSLHIVVQNQTVRDSQHLISAVAHELEHRFGITHATIQTEAQAHDGHEQYKKVQHSEEG